MSATDTVADTAENWNTMRHLERFKKYGKYSVIFHFRLKFSSNLFEMIPVKSSKMSWKSKKILKSLKLKFKRVCSQRDYHKVESIMSQQYEMRLTSYSENPSWSRNIRLNANFAFAIVHDAIFHFNRLIKTIAQQIVAYDPNFQHRLILLLLTYVAIILQFGDISSIVNIKYE
ncbi:hypothetical protein LOAG_01619 [Loa loa]|uniref:Uncharacterized protein n=1 Tax=Loa loa TaxID=7209 RepID=A0A1S0UAH6_LOALO|nr:hypothetical protein LOAG_01619 [Loa loa]EFO26871.1 hypothetical protein LOAG_01619 [Loa loa]